MPSVMHTNWPEFHVCVRVTPHVNMCLCLCARMKFGQTISYAQLRSKMYVLVQFSAQNEDQSQSNCWNVCTYAKCGQIESFWHMRSPLTLNICGGRFFRSNSEDLSHRYTHVSFGRLTNNVISTVHTFPTISVIIIIKYVRTYWTLHTYRTHYIRHDE